MTEKLVSIIIPCFNAESYILNLLKSIENQTYKNLECIIINDGSTDKSEEKIAAYITKNKIFKLISQENKGISISRNVGIQNANGEFILFMDADDNIPFDAIQNLINLTDTEADIIIGKTQITDISNNSILGYLAHNIQNNFLYDNNNKSFLKVVIEEGLSCVVMNKLYKTSFIKNNNLLFEEKTLHEDELWFFETIFHAKKIIATNKITYFYHSNNLSSFTNNRKPDYIKDTLKILDILHDRYYQKNKINEEKEIIGSYINHFKYIVILGLNLLNDDVQKLIQKNVFKKINSVKITRSKIILKTDLEQFYFHLFLISFLGNNFFKFYINNRENHDRKTRKKIKFYLKLSMFLNYFTYRKYYSICRLK